MKRFPELLLILFLLLFFYIRLPSNRWNQVIHSDGKGYYAHLPALFIYQDLEYAFADEMEMKYYPTDGSMSKHFRFKFKGETVNKTFSGITILWLPFFLLAHLLTFILGLPADGYSLLYQLSIGLSAIVYGWIGVKYLIKLLESFGVSKAVGYFTITGILFGSNYFYYLLLDPSLTHTYNFTLITLFLWQVKQYQQNRNQKHLLLSGLFFALILCVRPQNGFILFTLPFILGSKKESVNFIKTAFNDHLGLFKTLIIFIGIVSIPMLLWYLQTGYLLVYSYGNERFVFSNPQFMNVLFSYKKGLFVYSPIILLSMAGMLVLFKKNTFQFYSLLLFFVLNTYIISSWEEWWYGCSFGHRVFIDFYPIHAILLGILLSAVREKRGLDYLVKGFIFLFITYNLIQTYQHYTSIVPSCDNNKALYWHNFLRFTPEARVNRSAEWVVENRQQMDMESKFLDANFSDEIAFSGKKSNKINKKSPFSVVLREKELENAELLLISAKVYAQRIPASARLVLDIRDSAQNTLQYEALEISRFLKRGEWVHTEWKFRMGDNSGWGAAAVYFWQNSDEGEFFIDDFTLETVSEN